MHRIGQKENDLKYDDVSMLVHGCGVSQFPQFYEKIQKKYQLLPHPYVGSYEIEMGNQILKEKWIVELAKSVETFFMVSINDMTTINHC